MVARVGISKQLYLPFLDLSGALEPLLSEREQDRGAIYTRAEVVDFILDLVGYTEDQPLQQFRLLEPSFGTGAFLVPAVERLLRASKQQNLDVSELAGRLSSSIRAVEIHRESIRQTREMLLATLVRWGLSEVSAVHLLDQWIVKGDFLLAELPWSFTHVVGNPPYVRQELIPDQLLAEYRARYATIYDRADLYVPFIERCLSELEAGGVLGFICSDRWMKNKYGGPLRELIAQQYHLASYVDMVDTQAFSAEVIAYPAITVIKRSSPGTTRIAHRPQVDRDTLSGLARAMQAHPLPADSGIVEISDVSQGREPWILRSFDQLAVVRRLEAEFPSLEEAGCKVGIGVATGADDVYVRPVKELDVEPDRRIPLVKTNDIESGMVRWQGLAVINPFRDDGALVDLEDYPRLARYLEMHEDVIRARNCAKKNPKAWYRTIDRIIPDLQHIPKLLIPDIKGQPHIVYEDGHYYPHHNLYFVTSEKWDLRALQAVLQSGIARLFVSIYSTQMRGGYLRFQAQYLRRIRLPLWQNVPTTLRSALVAAAERQDLQACSRAAFDLYGLGTEERAAVGGNSD